MRRRHPQPKLHGNRKFKRKLLAEMLEPRLYMHAEAVHEDSAAGSRHLLASTHSDDTDTTDLHGTPVPSGLVDPFPGGIISAATYALTSVPVLNSLAGAAVSLYLNFTGRFDASWGGVSNILTPAYDRDGDATTFSDLELTSIYDTWLAVSEDYLPFNVNVTTVAPPSVVNGVAFEVAIGGDGAWTGGMYGGIAYVNGFTNSSPNVGFVFAKNLANGVAKYVADATSHESGHGFGLQHQSKYSSNGNLTAEYYAGPGNGTAPIMGNSYDAALSRWWYGTSTSKSTFQDDMSVIARAANGFGYRTDDHGNTVNASTALDVSGDQVSSAGFIGSTSDLDYFSFSTGGGQVTFTVDVSAYNNLDVRLEVRTATGTVLASASPTGSYGATLTTTLGMGNYRLVVAAANSTYGNVGKYTVSGTVPSAENVIFPPTSLTAGNSGGQVNLSWVDNAINETAYHVDRSTDGVNWTTVANLSANANAYADTDISAGNSYSYRVWADSATLVSGYSSVAQVTLPPLAPTGLALNAVSSSRIDLTWVDGVGETGYQIQRSTNGGNSWATIGTVGANVTSFQSTGLLPSTTYSYRVIATNGGGSSAASDVESTATQPLPPPPDAPTDLTGAAASSKQVNVSWQDNSSNESGFQVYRSANNGKTWTLVALVGSDVTAYVDQSVKATKSYSYRVRAVNDGGSSVFTNVLQVTTPAMAVPSNLIATPISATQIDLAWQDNGTDETGYIVQRSTDNGQAWKKIATVAADVTTFSDTTVKADKSYRYRVRGFNVDGNSANSNIVIVTTPSAALIAAANAPAPGSAASQVARVPRATLLASSAAIPHVATLTIVFADSDWLDSLNA